MRCCLVVRSMRPCSTGSGRCRGSRTPANDLVLSYGTHSGSTVSVTAKSADLPEPRAVDCPPRFAVISLPRTKWLTVASRLGRAGRPGRNCTGVARRRSGGPAHGRDTG